MPAWLPYATLAIALVGAALGMINTWHTVNQKRVRLQVIPSHLISPYDPDTDFSIEVRNLSGFAVTLNEEGFVLGSAKGDLPRRIIPPSMRALDGGSWPRRLEPRESISLAFSKASLARVSERIGLAYARSACGRTFYGDSPAIIQISR